MTTLTFIENLKIDTTKKISVYEFIDLLAEK